MGVLMLNGKQYTGSGGSLGTLSDVNISQPSNGQVPTYNSSTGKWENANPAGGADELSDLSDVTISSLSDGQALKYNSNTQKWENGTVSSASSFADLTDTSISNPSNGQFPVYNSTTSKWENITPELVPYINSIATDVTNTRVRIFKNSNNQITGGLDLVYANNDVLRLQFIDTSGAILLTKYTASNDTWTTLSSIRATTWSSSVSGVVADTSVTIQDTNIHTSSILELFTQNTSGTPILYTGVTVTEGQAVYAIPALTEATSFRVKITNF